MEQLFQLMYGKDTPGYAFGKGKGACARIQEIDDPRPLFQYDNDTWEANYEEFIGSLQTDAAKLYVLNSLKKSQWPLLLSLSCQTTVPYQLAVHKHPHYQVPQSQY